MSTPSYTEDSQFLSIRKLISDVKDGHISVPRFQRPFVWSDEQRIELLRSIKDKMPIGVLLVWRTSNMNLACFDHLGPYSLPQRPVHEGFARSYLLDGHQRLTTLYGLFFSPEIRTGDSGIEKSTNNDTNWNIQYNLRTKDFVFVRGQMAKTEPLTPLPHFIDSRGARETQRALDKKAKEHGWNTADVDSWSAHLDEICFRFTEYRIPVIPVVTDDIELATKTFSRVNSQGTPMNEANMVAAMTWTETFDLRERLAEIREMFPVAWRDLDERLILNTLKGLVGADITKAGELQLIKAIKPNNEVNKELLNQAQDALTCAIMFLHAERLVPHESLMPYGLQLVLLALALRDGVPTDRDVRDRLSAWFQLTTFWESYSGAKSSTIGNATKHVSAVIRDDSQSHGVTARGDISGLTRRFDLRSARSCGVVNALAVAPDLKDTHGAALDGFELLARESTSALLKLVPSQGLDEEGRALQQTIANVFIVPAEQHAEYRRRLTSGPDLHEDTLRAHLLTPAMVQALRAKKPVELLKERLRVIEAQERNRYARVHLLLRGTPPRHEDDLGD